MTRSEITELDRLKALYFALFPDGREREALPDIAYIRVKPVWLRSSDFRVTPPALSSIARLDCCHDFGRSSRSTGCALPMRRLDLSALPSHHGLR
jgi:hypothetical protein